MEFLVKVKGPDCLRQKDVIEEMRFGLHYVVGSAQKEEGEFDDYVLAIKEVKITPYRIPKPKPKVKRTAHHLKGD